MTQGTVQRGIRVILFFSYIIIIYSIVLSQVAVTKLHQSIVNNASCSAIVCIPSSGMGAPAARPDDGPERAASQLGVRDAASCRHGPHDASVYIP